MSGIFRTQALESVAQGGVVYAKHYMQGLNEADSLEFARQAIPMVVERRNIAMARYICRMTREGVNVIDTHGDPFIKHAVSEEWDELFDFCVEHPELDLDLGGWTVAHYLVDKDASEKKKKYLRILVEKFPAALETMDDEGYTPFLSAVVRDAAEKCELLLELGADANALSEEGQNAVGVAVQQVANRALAFLLGMQDLDPNHVDKSYCTPLSICVDAMPYDANQASADMVCLRLLLADPRVNRNCVDRDGDTPLLHAAKEGLELVVEALLEGGADPHLEDADGKTALDLAKTKRIRYLLRKATRERGMLTKRALDELPAKQRK